MSSVFALGLRYLTIGDGDVQLVLGSVKRKVRICFGMIEAPSLDNFTKKDQTGRLMVETLGKGANRPDRDERFEMKEGGGDQLGGWEEPIQGNMHGEVELISSGKADSEVAYAKTVLSAGERWRHVLTINAETYLWRVMPTWGDGAMFMFVDESELEARRFGQAVGTSQFT